jgi:4-hydroxy-3-methylbut-2-enyl diphosphate reductase
MMTFKGRGSVGFDPLSDLERIGVVNQTTMLAHETHAISNLLKQAMIDRFGETEGAMRVGDTRDTLCYATSENQEATHGLISAGGDLAIVVGGYNSSNTANLAELLESKYQTYYIKDAEEIVSFDTIRHLDRSSKSSVVTQDWLPKKNRPLEILITAGASCPDALVDAVMEKVSSFFENADTLEAACEFFVDAMQKASMQLTS